MIPWQIAITLAVVAIVVFNLLQRHYSQHSQLPQTFPPAMLFLLGVWPLGIVVGLSTPHEVNWSPWLIFLLIGGSLMVNISSILGYMAVKHLPLAQFGTINQLGGVFVVILGGLLLSEHLTPAQLVGGVLLIAGAVLAIQAPRAAHKRVHETQYSKAITLTVVGSVFIAIGLVAEKAALNHMDFGAYLIFGYGAQALGLVAIASREASRENLQKISRTDIKPTLIMGLALGITGTSYVASLAGSDNIALVTVIMSCSLPLTVFASYLVLHERDNPKLLYLSLALSFCGLLIVGLSK